MAQRYSAEFKSRAVRLVVERLRDDPSLSVTAALSDTALKLGVARESLRRWHTQDHIDSGCQVGITSEEHAEIRRLRQENKELRRTNEILKLASAFSPQNSTPTARDDRVH